MLFISGRISLDLAHSGGEGKYASFERLHTTKDLQRWCAESPLQIEGVRVLPADLLLARRLRAAIWETAHALRRGQAIDKRHVALLNRVARNPPIRCAWNPGVGLVYPRPITGAAVLATIARDAVSLFADQKTNPIRKCANPACPLLFVDGSRPGKRRWCSMERCGNMEKTKRYRRKD